MRSNSKEISKKAPPDKGACSFIYPSTPRNLDYFARILLEGNVVAIPTETVYGLAAVATNAEACRRIFAIKGRPLMDPLIVHVLDLDMAGEIAEMNTSARALAEQFWPGPLTMILKKKPVIPDIVTAGGTTVAIRMPSHPVARDLLARVKAPLAAPSANPFGYVSPSTANHVSESFGEKVPLIIDGGPCPIGVESSIIDLTEEAAPRILRPGSISSEAISEILHHPVENTFISAREGASVIAPGTLARHYSPKSGLEVFAGRSNPSPQPGEAVVFLARPDMETIPEHVFWYSENRDPRDIARNLFALLRKLDDQGYRKVHSELPGKEEPGLLHAVRDRLLRAASRG